MAGGAVGARAFGSGPPASNPGFQRWRTRVEDLATCPNVNVKLGGLAMIANGFELHRRAVPIGSEELAELWLPYFARLVEAFGADRCKSLLSSSFGDLS